MSAVRFVELRVFDGLDQILEELNFLGDQKWDRSGTLFVAANPFEQPDAKRNQSQACSEVLSSLHRQKVEQDRFSKVILYARISAVRAQRNTSAREANTKAKVV